MQIGVAAGAAGREAARWLASSRAGYCEATEPFDIGDCLFGDKGNFALMKRYRTPAEASAECLKACGRCERCRFVSLSRRDCSWYAACNLSALQTSPSGFQSGAFDPTRTLAASSVLAKASQRSLTHRVMEQQLELELVRNELHTARRLPALAAWDESRSTVCDRGERLRVHADGEPRHNEVECLRACLLASGCVAAQVDTTPDAAENCVLFEKCQEMVDAGSRAASVWRRRHPSWPVTTAAQVRWRTNATLVLASYSAKLAWLSMLPPQLMDVVLYQKVDDTGGDDDEASREVPFLPASGGPRVSQRLHELCAALCQYCAVATCAGRVAYFRALPNYQSKGAMHGGAREPHCFFQFLVDFYDNLPNVVVFSQDDGLYAAPFHREASALKRLLARGWESTWGMPQRPTEGDCLCIWHNTSFSRATDGAQVWPILRFVWRTVFNLSEAQVATRPTTWPLKATFAVGGRALRSRPLTLYRALLRLSTVPCRGSPTASEGETPLPGLYPWATAFERLWFDLLDPKLPVAGNVMRRVEQSCRVWKH